MNGQIAALVASELSTLVRAVGFGGVENDADEVGRRFGAECRVQQEELLGIAFAPRRSVVVAVVNAIVHDVTVHGSQQQAHDLSCLRLRLVDAISAHTSVYVVAAPNVPVFRSGVSNMVKKKTQGRVVVVVERRHKRYRGGSRRCITTEEQRPPPRK